MQSMHLSDIYLLAGKVRPDLLRVLATLPGQRQAEVLDFARYLGQLHEEDVAVNGGTETNIELRLAPAETLRHLTGLVMLGGDALADSETIYDDNGRY